MPHKIPQPESKFLKVICKCKNEQIIFNKPSQKVKCLVCGNELAEAHGGKAKVKVKVLETL